MWNTDEYRKQASEQTAAILRKMGTIQVGDTLMDFSLEDIDGQWHRLSELVIDKTLITFVKPDCDACLIELERLSESARGPDDNEHVLLITSANPLHLQKLRADYGLGCAILYDEERYFESALEIQTFPFNLLVNSSLVIEEIHANTLLASDYERFFEEVRSRDVETAGVSTYGAKE
ncbi:MAG: redoxin domain-containing protein [Candidatus Zixiibacteriota bacterium]